MGKIILNGTEYVGSGGSGGVIYLPTIYSEEEREVGAWTDGKPLYQKTVIIPNTSTINKDFTFAHGISNIDKVISANGMLWEIGGDSGRYSYFMPVSDNSNNTLSIRVSKTDIYFRGTNYFSVDANRNMYVTIQYTKTTDVAGSGNWNTDGVPTHHYSTNEQVIGTWVDGKPVYEMVFEIASLPNTTTTEYNPNISNFGEWVACGCSGEVIFASGNKAPLPYFHMGLFATNSINIQYNPNGKVQIQTGTDRTTASAKFVLQYTKTTD